MVRVKASTPLVNPALDWLKQIVFSPSTLSSASSVHEFAAVTCCKGASSPGNFVVLNVVPLTPDQTPKEAVIAWPISVICAGVFCAATVRIVGSCSAG